MGVRAQQYGKELEKETRRKQTLKQAHEKAVGKAEVRAKILRAGKWGKVRRTLYELARGSKAYLPEGTKPKKAKPKQTSRASSTMSQLKAAGLSDSDIARLQGKK